MGSRGKKPRAPKPGTVLRASVEDETAQGRDSEVEAVGAAMGGHFLGVQASTVADARAGVYLSVTVKHFAPVAAVRHPETIALAGYGREVANHDQLVARCLTVPQETDDAALMVVAIDPLETV